MTQPADRGPTLFLTGGTGFIGRRVCALNERGSIVAPGRSGLWADGRIVDESPFDLRDVEKYRGALNEHAPDVLVHLAWEGLPDYSAENSAHNLAVGLGLITSAVRAGVRRIVVAGSGWEYGARTGPLREDDVPDRPSVFAAYKFAQFTAAAALCREAGVELVWARIFFSYGPGQRRQSLVPSVVESLRRGEQPTLRTPGVLSDFIHVDDVARALLSMSAPGGPEGIVNVGTGRATPAFEVARTVAAAMGSSVRIPAAEITGGQWADVTRLAGEVGFTARETLESGIEKTVRAILAESNA